MFVDAIDAKDAELYRLRAELADMRASLQRALARLSGPFEDCIFDASAILREALEPLVDPYENQTLTGEGQQFTAQADQRRAASLNLLGETNE